MLTDVAGISVSGESSTTSSIPRPSYSAIAATSSPVARHSMKKAGIEMTNTIELIYAYKIY